MSFAPGPPLTDTAVRIVLLGAGELGREGAIESIRLGCEVLAVDRYAKAPRCMAVAIARGEDAAAAREIARTAAACLQVG